MNTKKSLNITKLHHIFIDDSQVKTNFASTFEFRRKEKREKLKQNYFHLLVINEKSLKLCSFDSPIVLWAPSHWGKHLEFNQFLML